MLSTVTRTENLINLEGVPPAYQLPAARVRSLFRGDLLGMESAGMPAKINLLVNNLELARGCIPFIRWDARERGVENRFTGTLVALADGDIDSAGREMKSLIESGEEAIIDLFIKWHTDGLPFSPFTSTTFSPKIAQLHASQWGRSTIYEIRLSPSRVIFDAKNEGGTDAGGEILVFGGISPTEITRIKSPNTPINSELFEAGCLKEPRSFDLSDHSIRDHQHWLPITG